MAPLLALEVKVVHVALPAGQVMVGQEDILIEIKEVKDVEIKPRSVAQKAFFNVALVLCVVGLNVIVSGFNGHAGALCFA